MEKNWAHSVDQRQLQTLQFLVHLVNLLSVPLRCNGFVRTQKAVADQQTSDQALFRYKSGSGVFSVHQLSWSSPVVA